MSHLPYRKDTNCLNCSTEVVGPYCHHCGQENIEPKESIWHLLRHFLNDVTHFDGKLFSTLKVLVTKPGFLSKEYNKGRRTAYLNPIRMYIFISAIFFFVFLGSVHVTENKTYNPAETTKRDSIQYQMYKKFAVAGPVMTQKQFLEKRGKSSGVSIAPGNYKSRTQYDSVLKAGKKHNWFERQLVYKSIDLNQKYGDNSQLFLRDVINKFFHLLPQMFFFLLPLFALMLKMFHVRNKDLYFTDHAIFTIHFYIYLFLSLILIILINNLSDSINWPFLKYISGLLTLGLFYYFYRAMRNYYGQGRGKTLLKYVLILSVGFFISVITFVGFGLLSIFEI